MEKKTIFTLVLVLIAGIGIFAGKSICISLKLCKPPVRPPITLVVWNLWDDEKSWKSMIDSYEALVANDPTKQPVKIVYYKKVFTGNEKYEDKFDEDLTLGIGPDILTIGNSWLPRYKNKIIPYDGGARGAQEYRRKFVDVVSNDFLDGNKIYAVPLSVDTLALYYNVDILNSAGISTPPRTWDEFNDAVRKITIRDDRGGIKRAGAAIGTDKNINRASDIFALLMMQSGSPIMGDEKALDIGTTAMQFYTDFANPTKTVYTWNPLMDYSIDAFYQMNAAMMINYSYTIPTVRAKAPNLKFAIAPMPQITGVTTPVNYANYWAMTVSSGSAHPKEAWDFLMYITNPEINKVYLSDTSKPAAQRDLVSWQENGSDSNLAVFARQSLTAKSWYQRDNFVIETIINDAIGSVVLGRTTPKNAVEWIYGEFYRLFRI